MASRLRLSLPNRQAAEPERPPPALSSDLLEEIFLRVASPSDLARASAACVSFRRLIANHCFLRKYRSIHPPLLFGFVSSYCFHPVEAPYPSAAVARAVAFSFDLLARTNEWHRWHLCDVRDGRVLVEFPRENSLFQDLAVLDPFSRRYLLLPSITDGLMATVELSNEDIFHWGASFIPSGGTEEDTSFSVILWMHSRTRLEVFVFSSVSGSWSVCMSTNCDVLGLDEIYELVSGQCAYDCFYWKLFNMSMLIKLDMNTKQFCTVDLPPHHNELEIIIVESGESEVAMFSLSYGGISVDYYTFSRNGSENSHGWHLRRTIALPADYFINSRECNITGPAEGYIFLDGIPIEQDAKHEVFSLDIKSFKIERIITTAFAISGFPYFGFPPSMSPRRI